LGDLHWQVHAAPGHDPHSVILFEPQSRTLVSADALWEKGFGVVFPELDGDDAFGEVAATLDVIERLNPATVIPGHGAPFAEAPQAIAYARQRLNGFVQNPAKHLQYAAKVLLKFKLLEARHLPLPALIAWARNTSYFNHTFESHFAGATLEEATQQLVHDLVRSGAATLQDGVVFDA
jgi:glyoxylase-like metal-dependent hydrolase (beta-lactamase superfamily II)